MPLTLPQILDGVATSEEFFPHQYDPLNEKVLIVRLAAAAIRAAPFLDQRVLAADTQGAWIDWADFERIAAGLPRRDGRWIFHVGHCGSTLVSQLLDAGAGLAPVREPLVLRTLAGEFADAADGCALLSDAALASRLDLFMRAARPRDGASVVKATSMCCGLAAPAFVADPSAKGLFVFVGPGTWLPALLGGANARLDLLGFAKLRWRRARGLFGEGLAPLSALAPGELAAMSWLVEAATIAAAMDGPVDPARLLTVDFDAFLKTPAASLERAGEFLGGAPNDVAAVVVGPLMKRYSKGGGSAYDAGFRERLIADYRREKASEVAAGMAWLKRAGEASIVAARALALFGD